MRQEFEVLSNERRDMPDRNTVKNPERMVGDNDERPFGRNRVQPRLFEIH